MRLQLLAAVPRTVDPSSLARAPRSCVPDTLPSGRRLALLVSTALKTAVPLLAAACQLPAAPVAVDRAGPPGVVDPLVGDPPAADVIAEEEYVIRLGQRGPCPAPTEGGWSVESMFDDSENFGPGGDDELGRYCVYSDPTGLGTSPFLGLDPGDGEEDDVSAFVNVAGSRGIAGRMLTGPSSADPAALAALHVSRFRDQAGQPIPRTGPGAPPAVRPGRQARLVVIDTVDESDTPFPYDLELFDEPMSHGLSLAVAAQQLTCANRARCPVQIATQDALTRTTSPGRGNAPAGQSWGTTADLASAIYEAVDDWREDRQSGRVGSLILNLSVAWHPWFGGGIANTYEIGADGQTIDAANGGTATFSWADVDPETWPADVRAVFAALRFARCQGALVFAAAGNATSGPRGQAGAMLPAAWEAVPLARLGGCPNGPLPDPSLPLLHAVGAVDANGDDLAVSRPASRPKLVAYGEAFTFDPATAIVQEAPPTLTGTSVSTVVVSSAAAMIASRHPNPTGANVMRVLLSQGDILDPIAPWSADAAARVDPNLVVGPDAGARLIRVCAPLVGRGYDCAPPAPPLAGFGEDDDLPVAELSWATPDDTLPACDGLTVHRDTLAGEPLAFNPCPQLTRWSTELSPWVLPQPPTESCDSCFIDVIGGRIGLNPTRFAAWSDLTLLVNGPGGARAYSLPAPPAGAPSVVWSWRAGAVPLDATQAAVVGVLDQRAQRISLPIVGR